MRPPSRLRAASLLPPFFFFFTLSSTRCAKTRCKSMGCGKTRDLPRFSPPSLSLLSYFLHSSSSRFFPLPSRCRIFSFSSFFFAKLAAIEGREIRIDRKNERRRRKKGGESKWTFLLSLSTADLASS